MKSDGGTNVIIKVAYRLVVGRMYGEMKSQFILP